MSPIAWHCPRCNPERRSQGFRFAAFDNAEHFPVCPCTTHMHPAASGHMIRYWYATGRWYGDADAMIEHLNLPDRELFTVLPSDLPPEGTAERAKFGQGRLDGYAQSTWDKANPIHPDGWVELD